jgi:hypothetical protein
VPKWKKDAKEFTVSVNYNEVRGYQSSIPKPIMDALGSPESVTFVINGDQVKLMPSVSSESTRTKIKVENSNKGQRRK